MVFPYVPLNENEWLVGVLDYELDDEDVGYFPRFLSLHEGRPKALPQAIDIFLWGALVVLMNKELEPFNRIIRGMIALSIIVGIASFTLFVICVPDDMDSEITGFFLLVTLGALVSSFLYYRSTLVTSIHARVLQVVQKQLVPRYRGVGYGIEYIQTPRHRAHTVAGIIRIKALTPLETGPIPPHYEKQVFATSVLEHRVAVTGAKEFKFPAALEQSLDVSARGAISETFTGLLHPIRRTKIKWNSLVVLGLLAAYFILFICLFDDDAYDEEEEIEVVWEREDFEELGIILSPLVIATGILGVCSRWIRTRATRAYEEGVMEISPLMQQRIGYQLEFVKQEPSWFGGSLGYIRFSPSATLSRPES
jgi:hypothetical protein